MTYYQTAAIAAQSGKFGAVMNSRIFKPRIQTAFEAAAKITPRLKAAVSPAEQIIRTAMPVNPPAPAGRL